MKIIYLMCMVWLCLPCTAQNDVRSTTIWKQYEHKHIDTAAAISYLRLDSIKGRIVILDFWNKYCVTCIKQMPKLAALQQKYKDRIRIIPVSTDSLQDVIDAYKRYKGGDYELKLPTIYGDTILNKTFQITGYPFAVWIDTESNFLAATEGSAVIDSLLEEVLVNNYSNLDRIAIMNRVQFKEKNSDYANLGLPNSLVSIQVSPFYSSRRMLKHNVSLDSQYQTVQLFNKSLYQLIRATSIKENDSLYNILHKDRLNKRMVISEEVMERFDEVSPESAKFNVMERNKWREENLFCLLVTAHNSIHLDTAKAMALGILEKTFNIHVRQEKRLIDCLILEKIPSFVKEKVDIVDPFSQVRYDTPDQLLNLFNYYYKDSPLTFLADDSMKDLPIDIIFDANKPYDHFIENLQKRGFVMTPVKRLVEMIIVD